MKQDFKNLDELMTFAQPLMSEEKYVFGTHNNEDGTITLRWMEHKHYTAQDGKIFPDEVWTSKDGELTHIQDLELEHARNIIRLILRNRREREIKTEAILRELISEMEENPAEEETQEIVSESVGHTLH